MQGVSFRYDVRDIYSARAHCIPLLCFSQTLWSVPLPRCSTLCQTTKTAPRTGYQYVHQCVQNCRKLAQQKFTGWTYSYIHTCMRTYIMTCFQPYNALGGACSGIHPTQEQFTIHSSLCLLCTPHSSSNFRHCSHSDAVVSTRNQSTQNGRGCRRYNWGGSGSAPSGCPTTSVLHLVVRDGYVTLGRGPGHSQSWCPRCHCLGQCNSADYWGVQERLERTFFNITLILCSECIQEHRPSSVQGHTHNTSCSLTLCTLSRWGMSHIIWTACTHRQWLLDGRSLRLHFPLISGTNSVTNMACWFI